MPKKTCGLYAVVIMLVLRIAWVIAGKELGIGGIKKCSTAQGLERQAADVGAVPTISTKS